MSFREDFTWGAATAAYQIEGAAFEDGKGPSIWDDHCHDFRKDAEGKQNVMGGDTGDVACDFYHRYREDIKRMKEMGLKAFRFSVSWARVLPNGIGEVNEKGLDFYSDLVDALLEEGIEPGLHCSIGICLRSCRHLAVGRILRARNGSLNIPRFWWTDFLTE